MRVAIIPFLKLLGICLLVVFVSSCSLFGEDKKEKELIAPLMDLPENAVRLDSRWTRSVGAQGDDSRILALTPALDGGSVYAVNAKGRVMAIARADGDVRWKTDLDVALIGAVGAGSDMVFASSIDGGLHAIDAANGQFRWRAQASSEILAPAATDGSVVVVQSVDSRVQAFDLATGKLRWSYSASQAVLSLRGNSAPIIRGGVVYAAFDNGKIVALNASTGLLLWEQRFIVPDGRSELERVIDVQGDPLVTADGVVVGCFQGAISSMDPERGRMLWQEKASVARSMASNDGNIFLVEGNDTVRALRFSGGREAWRAEGFSGRHLSAPAIVGDYVAVADIEGYVHLLSQADGSYAGRYDVGGGGVRVNLLSDSDALYVLTSSGKLYALGFKN